MSGSFDDWSSPFGPGEHIQPHHVQEAFDSVRSSMQQIRAQLPSKQATYDVAKQFLMERIHGGIDGIASTPSAGDMWQHYMPEAPKIRNTRELTFADMARGAFSAFNLAGSHAASGAQIALGMADGVNTAMGGQSGQIQERFAESAKSAVDNAASRIPQAFQNAREGFALSWNPFRAQSLLAQQRMAGLAGMAADGDRLHQPPLFKTGNDE